LKVWPVVGIAALQAFLFFGHWFIYFTYVSFLSLGNSAAFAVRIALFVLSLSFIFAALLSYRYSNWLVASLYKLAAVWLGLLNFLFWAACLCWIIELPLRLAEVPAVADRHLWIGAICFGAAFVAAIYGMVNARWIRERHVSVSLSDLPGSWRGRTALLISDMHLGNINGASFSRRVAAIARRLDPAIIFIAGDLFDGSKVDADRLAGPLFAMAPPFGVYFCGGNHEDFGDAAEFSAALTRGGIRVLHNEHVTVEGLHVVGVSYIDSTYPLRLRVFLDSLQLENNSASILLNHVPNRLPIVEQAGLSLQLSGHTHGGQIFPFTWITRRAFGKFTYGLQRFGKLQVYTSSGAGTWGPPMRVGSHPEVVLLRFA
jgi:predicted MPP superfamily phosphohydrolase